MDTIIGILFVAIFGTLLHFMYEWSGHKGLFQYLLRLMKVLGNILRLL